MQSSPRHRAPCLPTYTRAGALNFRLDASKQVGYRIALTWSGAGHGTILYAPPQPAVDFPPIPAPFDPNARCRGPTGPRDSGRGSPLRRRERGRGRRHRRRARHRPVRRGAAPLWPARAPRGVRRQRRRRLQHRRHMQLAWLANTDAGVMIGDYISTSIIPSDGLVLPVFALANLPHGSTLHEATNATPRQVVGSFGGTNPLESAPTFVVPRPTLPIPAPTAQ